MPGGDAFSPYTSDSRCGCDYGHGTTTSGGDTTATSGDATGGDGGNASANGGNASANGGNAKAGNWSWTNQMIGLSPAL